MELDTTKVLRLKLKYSQMKLCGHYPSLTLASFPPCVESSHSTLTFLVLVYLRSVDHWLFLSGQLMFALMDCLSLICQVVKDLKLLSVAA